MRIQQLIQEIENFAPLSYQESYDNVGLLVGDAQTECKGVLFCLDCTEAVIDEAIAKNCNLIISHHPVIFSGLKKLNGKNFVERTVVKAIKNDVALYACHTNIDNVKEGVNAKIAEKLNLENLSVLNAKSGALKKLVTYVPPTHHQTLLDSLFEAGAGHIGQYSNCSFNIEGKGTFKGGDGTKPFIGKANELSIESEIRIETIFPAYLQTAVLTALFTNHPYEEVAYDIYQLENKHLGVGSGALAECKEACTESEFLSQLKDQFCIKNLKHSPFLGKKIKKVAICGGSGKFLMHDAIKAQADVFITGDLKYHDYFEADGKILLVDMGHYESEQFTPEIFYSIITNKFPTFAVHLSKVNTNPVNYF
ncbi:MAG: Nif3-like dinuclear metal center hexameric protein [Bacteroidota bacterium]